MPEETPTYDFDAVDPFSFADTNIQVQNSSGDVGEETAVVNDDHGDPIDASDKQFGSKTEINATYKCSSIAAVTDKTVVLGGEGASNTVIESVSVKYSQNGHCEITIKGHDHGVAHEAKNAYTVTLPSLGFGAIDPLGDPASEACQSATWSAIREVCTHDLQSGVPGRS